MSVAVLDVPFVDVHGESLGWALGLPERVALAHRSVTSFAALEVELRVLGASHQVLIRRGPALLLSETVACDLPRAEPLPAAIHRGDYTFTSEVVRLSAPELAAEAERLRTRLDGRGDALLATFPGTPHAVTALEHEHDHTGIRWMTWHAYPQTGELVSTRSHFRVTEGAR